MNYDIKRTIKQQAVRDMVGLYSRLYNSSLVDIALPYTALPTRLEQGMD